MWNSNPGRWRKALTTLPLLLLGLLPACSTTLELPTGTNGPITYQHFTRHNPNQAIYVARVNLADPRVAVRVSPGGPDPDGVGPWVTTLLPTSEIAERDHFDLAVNGDFFEAENTKDIEGKKTGYIRGKAAAPVGPAMTEGKLWHSSRKVRSRKHSEFRAYSVARSSTATGCLAAMQRSPCITRMPSMPRASNMALAQRPVEGPILKALERRYSAPRSTPEIFR